MNEGFETSSIEIEKLKIEQEQLKLQQETHRLEQCKEKLKEEQEKSRIEEIKLNFERDKIKWNIWSKIFTVLITVGIGTYGVAYINNVYQEKRLKREQVLKEKELELQDKKSEADRRQAEMKYLGQFLDHALEDDAERRLRFAEYFAKLTVSPDLRKNWESYETSISHSKKALEEKEIKFAIVKNDQEKEKLKKEIENLKLRLNPLPKQNTTENTFKESDSDLSLIKNYIKQKLSNNKIPLNVINVVDIDGVFTNINCRQDTHLLYPTNMPTRNTCELCYKIKLSIVYNEIFICEGLASGSGTTRYFANEQLKLSIAEQVYPLILEVAMTLSKKKSLDDFKTTLNSIDTMGWKYPNNKNENDIIEAIKKTIEEVL